MSMLLNIAQAAQAFTQTVDSYIPDWYKKFGYYSCLYNFGYLGGRFAVEAIRDLEKVGSQSSQLVANKIFSTLGMQTEHEVDLIEFKHNVKRLVANVNYTVGYMFVFDVMLVKLNKKPLFMLRLLYG